MTEGIEDYFVVDPGKWYIKCGVVSMKTEPQVTILDRKEEREDTVCKALHQYNPQHLPLVLLVRPSDNLVLLPGFLSSHTICFRVR